jgi:hypothetical protein
MSKSVWRRRKLLERDIYWAGGSGAASRLLYGQILPTHRGKQKEQSTSGGDQSHLLCPSGTLFPRLHNDTLVSLLFLSPVVWRAICISHVRRCEQPLAG